jgi:zinc protease
MMRFSAAIRLGLKYSWVCLFLACTMGPALWSTSTAFAGEETAQQVVHQTKLENGLDVIVIPSPVNPIVTIEVCVRNGAFTETPVLNGLSHLYEHMFFKGNAVIPNQESYLHRMRELGIVFNGTTSSERVNYFFTLPSANLSDGLVFMRDAITTPTFDEEEFKREKKVVIGEIDRNESSPYFWFHEAMEEKLWGDYRARKDALGTRETVLAATIEQMKTMQTTYYVPNNASLILAGDLDPATGFRLVKEIFGGWKRGAEPFDVNPVPWPKPLAGESYVVEVRPVRVPYVQFGWHGPSVDKDPKSTFAADVLSYILSQPTSGFQKRLVESGVTLSAGLSYYTQRYVGPISLSAQVEPEKLDGAVRALKDELPRMVSDDYFTDEQLENAKTILAIDDIYGREKLSSFAHTVSFWWASASLDYYLNYVANLQAVTREDIKRYVNEYILAKPFVLGVLVSEEFKESKKLDEASLAKLLEEKS